MFRSKAELTFLINTDQSYNTLCLLSLCTLKPQQRGIIYI